MMLLRKIAILPILFYQKTLSLDHGPLRHLYPNGYCRYYPTCSEYGKLSVLKYGLLRGGGKACLRIVRCHPWSQGGIDHP